MSVFVSCGRAVQALHSARMVGSKGGSAHFYASKVGTECRGTAPRPTGESLLNKHGRGPAGVDWDDGYRSSLDSHHCVNLMRSLIRRIRFY